jgi:PAS domain-containing protein
MRKEMSDIVEGVPEGILVTDEQEKVIMMNPEVQRILSSYCL